MSDKPDNKNVPPDGRVRLSQLVTTFGPGAMIDLVHNAVLVGGLDYWRYDKNEPSPALDEHRLRQQVLPRVKAMDLTLSLDGSFRTGPAGKDDASGPWNGIQVAEFPSWFICQKCRALSHRRSLEKKGGRYRHQCNRSQVGDCVPVRFVVTCKDGHLDEFPWNLFVHKERELCDGKDLQLEEGSTGDFSEIIVRCKNCNQWRSMAEAREDNILPDCKGGRPWLGYSANVECHHKMHMLSRTASNAYFAQTVSVLSIPEKGRELQKAVSSAKLWPTLKKGMSAEVVKQLRALIDHLDVDLAAITNKSATHYSDEEIAAAVLATHGGADAPKEGLRTAEFKEFLTAKNETPGEIPPSALDFFASRYVPDPKKPLPSCLEDVTLVKKLRRVTAQVGFTRLASPQPNLQGEYEDEAQLAPLTLAENWLPATEVRGEGVLLRFREEVVKAWEERPEVQARAKALHQAFTKKFETAENFPGARYFMLHSLSHLLMTQMSLECGYAAASLGERIYCAPADAPVPMAAILILTGTSGAEGTLGGLIEQGRRIGHHLRRAFKLAALCSNDPVCAKHHVGHDDRTERYLEGAACHGCLYVAEPSCERFNGYLDRALVVPVLGQDPKLAFFGECP